MGYRTNYNTYFVSYELVTLQSFSDTLICREPHKRKLLCLRELILSMLWLFIFICLGCE